MSQPNNNNGDDHKYKKIFIGGLAWIVTTDVLRSFFQQRYGEVLDANVVSESLPGGKLKSKGYGFVTFRDAESANRACQPPYPVIEGRQTNINLAYLRSKNNPNHSNQTGLLHQAGPSHQYQNGSFNQMAWHPYQKGWIHQGAWNQYPLFNANPHISQGYWDSHYGAYQHIYNVPYCHCSSTMINSIRPTGVFQPPIGPRFEDVPEPNPETISVGDVVSDVDQQKGKDQEGEINGQDNGIKQDVKDQKGEIVSGEDDDTKHGEGATNQLCLTLQIETSENTPQENGLDHEEEAQHMTSENTPQENGLDHEEEAQHMKVGLITKKKET